LSFDICHSGRVFQRPASPLETKTLGQIHEL
jgi:hypothetical protein